MLAANPNFNKGPTIAKNADFSLTANFKATGLGNLPSDVFLTSSGGTAVLSCENKGGNTPSDPKKVDITFGPLQGETVSINPHNGQITASPSIGPPDLPSTKQEIKDLCGTSGNFKVVVDSLTYENVELHIQQDGVDILKFDFGDVDP